MYVYDDFNYDFNYDNLEYDEFNFTTSI